MNRLPFFIAFASLAIAAPAIAQGQIGTLERGTYVCELPGDAAGAVGVEQPQESFAILRACQKFGLPLIALRGISDGAEELHHLDDWTRLLHVVDQKLADAVDLLRDHLSSGRISL